LEFFVDGQPREFLKGEPLAKTIEAVRKELAGSGRAIISVFHDGAELSVEEENALCARRVEELGKVELRSTPAREWGLHGLGEVVSALGQLGDQFRACAELFRSGQLPEGLDSANAAIGLLMKVLQALGTSLTLTGATDAADLKIGVDAIISAMRELEVAVRASDGVAAADVAEYQLPEALESLAEKVRAVAAAAKKP
jgi:hypothetical protein